MRVHLALVVHDHQPVGNFDHVFAEAYDRAYRPFLDCLVAHPEIPMVLHHSGTLLDWIERHRPDYLDILRGCVARGQVELLTGGFYEPILPAIPEPDQVGQILRLTGYLEERLGVRPRGMWLTERVWEPHLPRSLARAGVEYLPVDDYHFRAAGLGEELLWGYYMTEEEGRALALFPGSRRLRYLIPFEPPEQTIAFLRSLAIEGEERLAVLADDGEKFGLWPGTYQWVYEKGWLEEFFALLEKSRDWLVPTTLARYRDAHAPLGRVYLPTASYHEMTEWALPTAARLHLGALQERLREEGRFEEFARYESLRGGFWRNFLAKYPEANALHKKMLRVSARVREQERGRAKGEARARWEEAREHLWAAQCNCPYWHGVFGGLYLPHLRGALYGHLLEAERLLDAAPADGPARVRVEEIDLDADGHREILLESPAIDLYLSPRWGGGAFEWDLKTVGLNLADVLARREEAYHHRLREGERRPGEAGGARSIHDRIASKEEGLEGLLNVDWYRRMAFLDHLLGEAVDLEGFARCAYEEVGDFVDRPYSATWTRRRGGKVEVSLRREGGVWLGGQREPLAICKAISLDPRSPRLEVTYRLANPGAVPLSLRFGVEVPLGEIAVGPPDRHFVGEEGGIAGRSLAARGEARLSRGGIRDGWRGIDILFDLSRPALLWHFPLETVSLSEVGIERIAQGVILLFQWEVRLGPGEDWGVSMGWEFPQSPRQELR